MDEFLNIIRERKRREILILLTKKMFDVGGIVEEVKISQPAVSMILKELRDKKLVDFEISGKKRIYKMNYENLKNYIKEVNEFLKKFGQNYDNEIIVRR